MAARHTRRIIFIYVKIKVHFLYRCADKRSTMSKSTTTETMMKLSARFEIRRNGKMNSARFTKEAANRIARALRAQGTPCQVIEH